MRDSLFGYDRVGLGGVQPPAHHGLALGLVLALQMQRNDAREQLPPLEEELAASLNDPAGVAAGKHRDPSAVEGEIDVALDDLQRSFLLWWLVPGLGVGLLLSRLRVS